MATPEENAALARRYLADVVAANEPAARNAFLTEDARVHDLGIGRSEVGWPVPGEVTAVDVADVIATEDRVAARGTVRGHTAPDGDPYAVAGAWFCHVEDGRIAELWSLPVGLGPVRRLGTLPVPPFHRDGHDSKPGSET